ncbi:hypothetical protein ABIA43_004520 [Bradyrhizobium sp. USDA 328]
MSVIPADTLTEAIAAIEDVSSRIEDVFARVGHELGRGHLIFKELNQGLATLSSELSGAEIEGAATALQEIGSQRGSATWRRRCRPRAPCSRRSARARRRRLPCSSRCSSTSR